jgi:hypothetical protein
MELTEPIESINKQLVSLFGIDSDTGRPMFRVVSSWDQYEKRLTNITPEGFKLQYPQVLEKPKYNQNDVDWKDKYILERLVIVPLANQEELPTSGMSYEPLWVFKDNMNNPLPPRVDACKLVIDTMYAALGKSSMAKYVDPEINPEQSAHEKAMRVQELEEQLFGDESNLLLRTVTGEAVGYTGEPKITTPVKENE